MYCMSSNIPRTKYVVFNYKNAIQLKRNPVPKSRSANIAPVLINSDELMVVRGKKTTLRIPSYQAACSGDSGSGQFVFTTGGKAVLIAVYVGRTSIEYYEDESGEKQEYPCGTFTWRDNKYRFKFGKSESTAWKENLDWIKMRAKIG